MAISSNQGVWSQDLKLSTLQVLTKYLDTLKVKISKPNLNYLMEIDIQAMSDDSESIRSYYENISDNYENIYEYPEHITNDYGNMLLFAPSLMDYYDRAIPALRALNDLKSIKDLDSPISKELMQKLNPLITDEDEFDLINQLAQDFKLKISARLIIQLYSSPIERLNALLIKKFDALKMEQLDTLRGEVKIRGYRSQLPIIKDSISYVSNENLLQNCIDLPIDKALDALEQELKLIMTHTPWVFSINTLKYVNDYTDNHKKLSQYILNLLANCIKTLLEKFDRDHIDYNNLHRICNLICSIDVTTKEYPHHITQDCTIINEGNVGVSNSAQLGTIGTFSCICLAIKDVDTGIVFFTHVNDRITKESLGKTIKHVFPNSNNMIARLFGGTTDNSISRKDIRKIINALPDNIKIISADIANTSLDPYSNYRLSTTFVIDPQTFEVTNSCPVSFTHNFISYIKKFNSTHYSTDIFTNSSITYPLSCNKKLHISYINGQYTPLLLKGRFVYDNIIKDISVSNAPKFVLRSLLCHLQDHMSTTSRDANDKFDNCYSYQILLSLEIKTVIDSLIQKAQDTAKEKDIQLSEQSIDLIVKTLASINLYIGPNSSEANKPIFDFIENHLFKDGNTLDLDGLSKIEMGHDSHCYLQPAKDISNPTADESMESPVENMALSANFH